MPCKNPCYRRNLSELLSTKTQINTSIQKLTTMTQIYDTKCLHYIDWLVETRPSFSPPRRDLRPPGQDPGANEVYTERLDTLNTKFQRLLEQLTQRLRTAIEVSGADGLVSRQKNRCL